MSTVFFAADPHFGHAKLLAYESDARPFETIAEHDDALVARWNATVGKRDVVWLLGDVAWSAEAARAAIPRLQGRLRLILGDHDQRWLSGARDLLAHFELIGGCEAWKDGIVLSHHPLAFDGFKYTRCIHGHTHSHMIKATATDRVDNRESALACEHPDYACVSLEQTGLAPISWDGLRQRKGW
jgi:calcineurin-like phosphoesterase family protein